MPYDDKEPGKNMGLDEDLLPYRTEPLPELLLSYQH